MNALNKTIKSNRVTILWYTVVLLVLGFSQSPGSNGPSLAHGVLEYWTHHGGQLFSQLGHTLTVAFPAAVVLLIASFIPALAAASKPILNTYLKILILLMSLLPSVYLLHLVRIMAPGASLNEETFAALLLVFSNLVLYFFYLEFKKDISRELRKDYHFLANQLGVKSKLASAAPKLVLITVERFLPLFIMVFSATIFVESKLNISGGIYTALYDNIKSIDIGGRPDIFWGQLLFILGFLFILQLAYGTLLNYFKERYS